jgi:hypothetical protein
MPRPDNSPAKNFEASFSQPADAVAQFTIANHAYHALIVRHPVTLGVTSSFSRFFLFDRRKDVVRILNGVPPLLQTSQRRKRHRQD